MEKDNVVLALVKEGDRNAFDVIFKKYSPKLYFFSLKFFNKKEEAEEIVQETFVRIWEKRHTIDPEKHFNTYLVSIAKHIIYNHFRHKLVEQKYFTHIVHSSEDSYLIEEEISMKNLRMHLFSGMDQLPPQQKEILLLKHKGYDNDEIAARLRISKRTVETHINKAFRFLRKYLSDHKELFILLIATSLADFL